MRTLIRLIPLFLFASISLAEITVPEDWLVLSPVDRRARQPFNPDAVFARYLLEPGKEQPKAGASVVGTRGERPWRWAKVDEKGQLGGRFSWAYATVTSDSDQVAIVTLRGGAVLYVNGVPHVGDIYGYGHEGVPVRLQKGANEVYVRGVRGKFKLAFREVNPGVHLSQRDATMPDAMADVALDAEGSITVVNTSDSMLHTIPAMGVRRLPVAVKLPILEQPGKQELELSPAMGLSSKFTIAVRSREDARRVTFRSDIDGSVQYYAVRAPERIGNGIGIVLTLHGAGVQALGQAKCYANKPDVWIVAPTNRRPYGFDWQDWGRLDAYEVLRHAATTTGADPRRVYLTGHSMGGHGTWHLAANDPSLWLGVAPCAGWESFDTYGSGGRSGGKWDELWRGADLAGATPLLMPNLAQLPVFILHGEEDKTVPVSEARRMFDALEKAGGKPRMHLEPNKGHWYDGDASKGADCVDWPGIFEMFDEQKIRGKAPRSISWVCADPGIDAVHHWVTVIQPLEYGKVCSVEGTWGDDGVVRVQTRNVRKLSIAAAQSKLVIDGQTLEDVRGRRCVRDENGWRVARGATGEKSPVLCGPFKRAFGNRFVLVYAASDPLARQRALYDAQRWWYVANGDCTVVSDAQFLFGNFADRNVILYGNADSNQAWKSVLPANCPLSVRNGAVEMNGKRHEGDDLSCFFVYPRRGSDSALVGVIGHTGDRGARAGAAVSIFGSGVGIPDYMIFGADVLTQGDAGVHAAGWFDHSWRLKP